MLEGLVAECGCFRGLSSYLLCSTLQQADAAFDGSGYRIFDSFAGLSAPSREDAIEGAGAQVGRLRHMTRAGNFAASLDKVKFALSAFPRIEYFPGWIPAAFPQEDGVAMASCMSMWMCINPHATASNISIRASSPAA